MTEKAFLTYEALNQSGDLILLIEGTDGALTADTLIVGMNDAFQKLLGYDIDKIINCSPLVLFKQTKEADCFYDAIRSGRALRAEFECNRADGTTFVLGMHLMPAPTRTPGRKCFVVIGRDITDLLEARQAEGAIQRLLAKVFVSTDSAVAILNSDGRIVMCNPACNHLLKYKPGEIIGRSAIELAAPASRAAITASTTQQMENKQDLIYYAPIFCSDGSLLPLQITSVLVPVDKKQFRILTLRLTNGAGAAEVRTESAGHINLIGLDEVRAALGDRWPAVAARAMATAEVVLKHRCGPQDSYSRADDTSFVVCFGALSEQEAAFRAAMIGREIRDRLIGQGETPDTAFVRTIAAKVRIPAQASLSDGTFHASLLDGLDKQLAHVEEEARQILRAAWAGSVCELNSVSGSDTGKAIANQICLPGELEQRLLIALSALTPKESAEYDLDAMLVALAAQQVISAMRRGVQTPLLVNVRFDVFLTSAATQRFLVACRKIDTRVSSRLILMLSELPQGLPKSRLLDCVTRLRPFCSGVGYHANDLAAAGAIDLSNSFNPIVALPFGVLSAREADRLKRTIAALQAGGARVMIHKVVSEKSGAVLRSLGADMIVMNNPSASG